MPLATELGLHFLMPITGDYFGSMAIAFALVLSAFYSIYFMLFYYLSTEKFRIPAHWSFVFGVFIILLHFLPFLPLRGPLAAEGYDYMYASGFVTGVFNYTIPALLNASLVLLFSSKNCMKSINVSRILEGQKLRYGILFLAIYLAINSNMLQSVLFIAYISSELMFEYIKSGIKQFLNVCRENIIWLGVIFVWLLSLLMESQGGRAMNLASSESYLSAVGTTINTFIQITRTLNPLFILIFVAAEGLALILFLTSRKAETDDDREYACWTAKYLISLLITTAYLVLVCAKANPIYLARADVFSGILFFVMTLIWTSLIYIFKKTNFVFLMLPIAIYVLLFETAFNEKLYREINLERYKAFVVRQIDNYILEQVLLADSQGKTTMELYVPVYNSSPLTVSDLGGPISRALFAHGMISKQIQITVIPTYDMDEAYNLQQENR